MKAFRFESLPLLFGTMAAFIGIIIVASLAELRDLIDDIRASRARKKIHLID